MTITEKQREARNLIGSSDLAAVLNMSPWANAHDVFMEKVYGTDPLKENKAMQAGNLLEEPLMQFTVMTIGKLVRNQTRRVKGYPIRVNTDGIIQAEPAPVEGKCVGLLNPYDGGRAKEWGDDMTSEVPDDVAIQAHGHMLGMTEDPAALKGFPQHCYVPTILSGRGFVMFIVPFDREVANMILEGVQAFWTEHVVPRVPPDDVPHLETIKRVHRLAGLEVDLGEDSLAAVTIFEACKHDAKEIKSKKKCWQEEVLSDLGDAEAGRLPDGRLVTFYQQSRRGIDKEKLQRDFPDVFAEVQKTSTFRKLRIKNAPKALPKPKEK